MSDWGIGSGGQLIWQGGGNAPFLSGDQQQQVRSAGGGATPAGAQYGVYSPSAGAAPIPIPQPKTATTGGTTPKTATSGQVKYTAGPITSIVNDLLTASINGTSKPGPGQTLNQLSRGIVPDATEKQFLQNQGLENAAITESMGKVGNRFGTDLSRTLADAAGRANVNLSASAMDRALAAISQIIGLGTGQSSLEFAGNQASLDRANQDFLSTSGANDPFLQLLPFLLQMG